MYVILLDNVDNIIIKKIIHKRKTINSLCYAGGEYL